MVAEDELSRFLQAHRLPESFRETAIEYYSPIADWIATRLRPGVPLLLGINGAQGTGKSTLADFLCLALRQSADRNIAVLSIDDFYLTRSERQQLAAEIHPLLVTRGVPGTHDLPMLETCLSELRALEPGVSLALPRFDKARDDRADETSWPTVSGPVDVVILEGWCVGSRAGSDHELHEPINALERNDDPDGAWRRYVNERLASDYASLFGTLDALIFLKAPSFDAIYRWRLEQEQKLAATAPDDVAGIMDEQQIARFIAHYERITRRNIDRIGEIADVVLELDEYHRCVASHYRS